LPGVCREEYDKVSEGECTQNKKPVKTQVKQLANHSKKDLFTAKTNDALKTSMDVAY
jgi:hypothetical protein